jgi:vancomycin permeability regulator SanA
MTRIAGTALILILAAVLVNLYVLTVGKKYIAAPEQLRGAQAAVVVTQEFHLPRALYIARSLGLNAVGVSADKYRYTGVEQYYAREIPARVKDFFCVLANVKPRFLGDVVPVTGDARVTHDN